MKPYLMASLCIVLAVTATTAFARENRDHSARNDARHQYSKHRGEVRHYRQQRIGKHHGSNRKIHRHHHYYNGDRHWSTSYRFKSHGYPYSSEYYRNSHRYKKQYRQGHRHHTSYFVGGAVVGALLNKHYSPRCD